MAMPGLGDLLLGNAYAPFTLGLSSSSAGGSTTSSSATSSQVTAIAGGGSGQFEGTWARRGGSSLINPTSPNSLTTAFSASSLPTGQTSATFDCTVKDKVTGETKVTGTVTVTLERGYPALSGSVSGAYQTGTSSSVINVTAGASASASGGVPPYSYSWGGGSGFTVSPSGSTCYFGVALGPGQSASSTGYVIITDSIGQSTLPLSFPIACSNNGSAPPPLSISANPTNLNGFGNDGSAATGSTTFTVSGGVGPFTISVGGGPGFVVSPSGSGRSHSTNFTCTNIPMQGTISATFTGTVIDHGNNNNSVSATVSATFWNFAGIAN